MTIAYDGLVVLHLLGMAALLGGAAAQWWAPERRVPTLVLAGAAAQVLTGFLVVGLASSGLVAKDLNHAKVAVKLAVAVAVLTVVVLSRRSAHRDSVHYGRVGIPAVTALALGNVLVALYW